MTVRINTILIIKIILEDPLSTELIKKLIQVQTQILTDKALGRSLHFH